MPFKKILVGIDGSQVSKGAALESIRIAKDMGSTVLGVYVIPMGPDMIEYFKVHKLKDGLKENAKTSIEEIRKEAENEGVPFHVLIEEGNPSEKIIETAKRNDCDLIVLGRKGKSAIEKLLVGSIAERVAGESHVPVMLVPG